MIGSKLSQTRKTKVFCLYEETLYQYLNPILTSKIVHWGPKKVKNNSKITSKWQSKFRIKGSMKNKKLFINVSRRQDIIEPYIDQKQF